MHVSSLFDHLKTAGCECIATEPPFYTYHNPNSNLTVDIEIVEEIDFALPIHVVSWCDALQIERPPNYDNYPNIFELVQQMQNSEV